MADTLRTKGIHWIMINFPVSPYYRGDSCYSVHGPSWGTAHDILDYLRDLDSQNQFFTFYDAHNDGNHDYSDADAFYEDHLSEQGAEKLTPRVDSIIHTLIP
jgi:hypothetical protein